MLKYIFRLYSRWQITFFVENILDEFKRNLEEDDLFFRSLSPCENDFDRTHKQHLCQTYFLPFYFKFIINLLFLFFFPLLLLFYFFKKKPAESQLIKTKLIGFGCINVPNIYPCEIADNIYNVKYFSESKLLWRDLVFMFKFICNYPFSFWLTTRLLFKVASYRGLILKYNPKAICITGENTATSSALTAFCEENNVSHYNFMSGEMFSTVNIAFFRFHKCYVMDKHYVKSFLRYNYVEKQFIIYRPLYFSLEPFIEGNPESRVDFTYYLSAESEQELSSIYRSMEEIKKSGYTYRVRPHLRWTDLDLVKKYFCFNTIEDYNNINIQQSISSTNASISLFSSVLLQSHYLGKTVIIDDLTNPDKYLQLFKLDYIILDKPHLLLSSILNR